MRKSLKKLFSVIMILTMIMTMNSAVFAGTDYEELDESNSWTSFQGNSQNNGVITESKVSEEGAGTVLLLDETQTTGFSGVDCQPLMTTEDGKTFAYVVTDSNSGPKAFKVDCAEHRVAKGWENGVKLSDVSCSQLGTGTIVGDTWYLPVSYDVNILPNPYFSYEGGWDVSTNMRYTYSSDWTGIKFKTVNPYIDNVATLTSDPGDMTIDVSKEDIWANFSITFGACTALFGTVELYIKPVKDKEWIEIGKMDIAEIESGFAKDYSVNCTKILQKAGKTGEQQYQLRIDFRFRTSYAESPQVTISQAGINKNNMYLKKIDNLSSSKTPQVETLIDFHEYEGSIPGGRSAQFNTPLLYVDGNLYFGDWIRGDEGENNYAKYFKYNIENDSLDVMETGRKDDGFYFAGAASFKVGKDDCIAFGSTNGMLYMFNAETLELISQVQTDSPIKSSVCYADGSLYFTRTDGVIDKFEIDKKGQLVQSWEYNLGLPTTVTPVVKEGKVYVTAGYSYDDNSGKIFVIDAQTGGLIDELITDGGTVAGSFLICETVDGKEYVYFTTNNADGHGTRKALDGSGEIAQFGSSGYTLQGFAATKDYLVFGNDGNFDEAGNCRVELNIVGYF